jgi:hypothetical protein
MSGEIHVPATLPQYQLNRRLGGTQIGLGVVTKIKTPPSAGSRTRIARLVTIY